MLKSLLLAALFLCSFFVFSQTGPGGVEDYTTTSNLKLWVSADSITGLSDNDEVSSWPDITSEANDGSQGTSSLRPLYDLTNTANGKPTLSFDGGDYLDFPSPGIGSTSSFEYFVVLRANSFATGGVASGGGDYVLDRTSGTTPLVSLKASTDGFYGFQKRANNSSGLGGPETTTGISTTDFQMVSFGRNVGTGFTIHLNGTEEDNAADGSDLTPPIPRLGRHATVANDGLNGNIAEFIIFDKYLNTAERTIINNYLGAKYGITSASDLFAYEGSHGNQVAGIGQASDATNQLAASSSLELQISGATGLDNSEFALFGHDAGNNTAWVITESPTGASNFERLAREWRIDKNGGDLGAITFQVDANVLPTNTYTDFVVLVDSDGDFTSGSTIYLLSDIGGGLHSASLTHAQVPDGSYITIANITRSISLAASTVSEFETVTNPSITVSLNYAPTSAVTFDYVTADNTAIAGSDYTAITTTQGTILANTSSVDIPLTIIDDGDVESTEDFDFTISNPSDGSSIGIATVTYSILDNENPRKASFVSSSDSGGEAARSTVFVSIQVSSTDTDPITVSYEATGGTAINGVDYDLTPGFVTIPADASQSFFSFTVTDDAFEESDETIEITLTNTTGDASLSETPGDLTFTYTINNDDNVPVVQFPTTSATVAESVSPGTVPIDLSSASQGDITIDYTVSGLALGGGVDHELADGSLTITAGNISGSLSFAVIDDSDPELTEDIIIKLTGATGADLGTNTVFTYNISDNDDFGTTGPGGVGSSTVNRLWLRVEEGGTNLFTTVGGSTNPSDGNTLRQWDDISGNGFDATTTSNEPTFSENAFANGKDALGFAGNNFIDPPDLGISNSTSGYTYFIVPRVNSTPDQGQMNNGAGDFLLDRTSATSNLVSLKVTDDDGVGNNGPDRYGFQKRTDTNTALGGPISNTDISLDNFEILSLSRLRIDANNADYFLHTDGTLVGSETGNPNEGETTPPTPRIGRHATNANNGINGDIAEFIVFGAYLNDTRRIIVENYLSSRFGIAVTQDRYAFDASYGEDVAGIGKESADSDDFHEEAQSAGILTVDNPSSLGTGDYLLFGHNGGAVAAWGATNVPDASYQTSDRVWQFDETGDMGTVDLTFNTLALPALPTGFTDYYLFIDNDDDLSNGLVSQTLLTESGNDRVATGVSIEDGYYVSVGIRNDFLVDFVSTSSNFGEDSGSPTVEVSINQEPTLGNDVTVDIAVQSSTATEGVPPADFQLTTTSVTFTNGGSLTQNVTITINDDSEIELVENIVLVLQNPVVGAIGETATTTILINDNDNEGFVGPAGVGDAANNVFWIRSDSITAAATEPSNNDDVTSWIDLSGNGNDLFQNIDGRDDPIYTESAVNGFPTIRFDGNDLLQGPSVLSGNVGRTVFVVAKANSVVLANDAAWMFDLDKDRPAAGTGYLITPEVGVRVSGNRIFDQSFGTSDFRLLAIRNATGVNASAIEAFLEGASLSESALVDATLNTGSSGIMLGGIQGNASFEGEVTEIIVYDQELNDAQRIIIENYLSTRYSLNNALATDVYSHDSSHPNDLAGIGRTSSTSFHNAAQSNGYLTISNASDLGDNEFLLFAHDGAAIDSWVSTDVPGENFQRLAREYRVDETGDVGSISVAFEGTQLPSAPAGLTEYVLLVDADGDFTSGATQYSLTLSSADYVADNIDVSAGDYLAIGIFRPVVAFTSAEASVTEDVGNAVIPISLNFAVSQDITLDYALTGTASGGDVDYDLADGQLTFLAGETSINLSIPIIDDGDAENDETIIVTLSNASIGEVDATNDTYTVTINDDDNTTTIDFAVSSSSGSEATTPANVTLRLNQVSGTDVTVEYAATGGTASGADFTLDFTQATITAGNLTTTIPITISTDAVGEADETIELTLSNPTNASLGINTVHNFTIIDDDPDLEANFTFTSSGAGEEAGVVGIEVNLSDVAGSNTTINYSIIGGTATDVDDFTLAASPLVISSGNQTGDISINIVEDAVIEGGETVIIQLSTADGASIGANNTITFVISDNDNEGSIGPGGVGDANNNVLWVKADSITTASTEPANNADITSWIDLSGNGNDIFQNTEGHDDPLYIESAVNGLPSISFDGNDALEGPTVLSGTTGRTVFVVAKADDVTLGSTVNYMFDLDKDRPGSGTGYLITPEVGVRINGNRIFDQSFGTSDFRLLSVRNAVSASASNIEAFLEGASLGQSSLSEATINTGSSGILLGGLQATASFEGDISEIIVYDQELNDAQRIIIENYLHAKYALPNALAIDYYSFQGTHPNDVAGIGRIDASNQHFEAQSAGTLTLGSPSAMGDNDFLLFGHDGGSISSWSSTDVPDDDTNIQRIAREWRVDSDQSAGDGDLGSLSVTVSNSLLQSFTAGYDDLVLLVDGDGLFNSGATFVPLSDNGDGTYEAAGVSIADNSYLTLAIVRQEVQFELTSSQIGEQAGPASITVSTNRASSEDITVTYTLTGGTAQVDDYTVTSPNTLTISAGNTSAGISVGITNDSDPESSETLIFTLSSPTGAVLGTNTVHTLSIDDDDQNRTIDFSSITGSDLESESTASFTVQLNFVDNVNPTTVNYAVTGGTATGSGIDYTLAAGTVEIAATQSTATVDFFINEDNLLEDNETIIITLSDPVNAGLGSNDTFTYTITNNDTGPEIAFTTVTPSSSESVTPAQIEVSLSNFSGLDASVNYAVTGGTASLGTDFSLSSGTVVISAGSLTGNILPVIFDDTEIESGETIIITLSGESGAILGSNSVATFTIADNDNDGFTGPGGVGDSNNNVFWIRSDSITSASSEPTANADVTTWIDLSGNGNNLFQNVDGNDDPIYVTNEINGFPAVSFDGNDALEGPSVLSGNVGRTVFLVAKSGDASLGSTGTYLLDLDKNRAATGSGYLITSEVGVRVNGNRIFDQSMGTANYRIVGMKNPGGAAVSQVEAFLDGTQLNQSTLSEATLNTGSSGLKLGGLQTGASLDGEIAEVIVYNQELNDAQRIIVDNYLSARYGIAIANDFFSNGSYSNDVAGIGQAGGEQHTGAQSAGILSISSAASLDADGEFIFFGHDNGAVGTWTTNEAPNSGENIRRLSREWLVEITGTPGSTSIAVDASTLPALPSGFDTYYILVDTDGDFSSGSTTYSASLNGDGLFEATGVTLNSNDFITVAVVRPVVEFTATSSSEFEPDGPATVEVSLNFPIGSDVDVNYQVTGGTASGGGVDYTLADGTATITAGNTTTSFQIFLTNDTDGSESNETVIITLSSVPSANATLGTDVVHTFTINDDDNLRKIFFATENASGAENTVGTNNPIINITAAQVDPDNATTVDIAVGAASTATLGDDFTLSTTTVTIPATQTSSSDLVITINDDGISEGSETIVLELSNPVNGNLASGADPSPNFTTYTFTITDNDAEPTIQFVNTSASVAEDGGSAQIALELSAASGQDVSVGYTISLSGTATAGDDYSFSAGTAEITAGNTTTNLNVTLSNDSEVEEVETLIIDLTDPPANASLGANQTFTLSITDDDNDGIIGPGGVGDASNNVLWIRSDSITTAIDEPLNNADITSWIDLSGNGNDIFQNVDGLDDPIYVTSAINGLPAIRFDGNDALEGPSLLSGTVGRTVFVVAQADNVTGGSTATYLLDLDKDRLATGAGYLVTTEVGVRVNGNRIFDQSMGTTDFRLLSVQNASGVNAAQIEAYLEGTALGESSLADATLNTGSSGVKIGGLQTTGTLDGDIAEIIVYNVDLNEAQRIIVENYLHARYNLTNALLSDRFDENQGTIYNNDVAGIGRVNDVQHSAAQSAGLITIEGALSLDNNDFLLVGHDDGAIDTWTATEAPSASLRRIAREWYVDETNEVGNLTVKLADASLLDTRPANFDSYVLLTDADGDFSSGANIFPLANTTGNEYETTGIDLSDGYLTFAVIQNVTDGSDGDFNNIGTWTSGVVPGAGQSAIVTDNDDVFLSEDITIGQLTINNGATLDLAGYNLTIDTDSIQLIGTGALILNSGTVTYSAAGAQNVSGINYHNLVINGTGTKTLIGPADVDGNLTINSTLDVSISGNHRINLAGNLDNNGVFSARNGQVVLDGSTDQTFDGDLTFYDLQLNKTAGNLVLNTSPTVSSVLEMTGGDIVLGNFDLTIGGAGSIDGASATSYIQADGVGLVIKEIDAVFPGTYFNYSVGDATNYTPFHLSLNTATLGPNARINVNIDNAVNANLRTDAPHLSRYWTFEDNDLSGSIDYDIAFVYNQADDVVGNEAELVPIKFLTDLDTTGYTQGVDFAVNVAEDSIFWNGLTTFSEGTAGVDEDDPVTLPIELLFVKASLVENDVLVEWATESELNNDFFTIEKSYDWETFIEVGTVDGSGDSDVRIDYQLLDRNPYPGVSYYRLKQTDYDGTASYSSLVTVETEFETEGNVEFDIYPIPSDLSEGMTLSMNDMVPGTQVTIKVVALDGRESYMANAFANQNGEINRRIVLPSYAARGQYIVYVAYDEVLSYIRTTVK